MLCRGAQCDRRRYESQIEAGKAGAEVVKAADGVRNAARAADAKSAVRALALAVTTTEYQND